jgi:protocatechuate 3,4-dioxygenase beta subunit
MSANLLLLAAALWLAGQAEPAKAPEPASITGIVFAADTSQPLPKAVVRLYSAQPPGGGPPSTRHARSDERGRFRFDDVEPGRYSLTAFRTGYATQSYGRRSAGPGGGAALTVLAGQQVRDLRFRLLPAGVITGRVTDEDGEPLANARVTALRRGYREGRRQLFPAGMGTTDDRGEFRVHSLAPGSYYLTAARGFSPWLGGFSAGDEGATFVPLYYPGTYDSSQASVLAVRAGDEVRADLRLFPEHVVKASGRVINTIEPKSRVPASLWVRRRGESPQAGMGPPLRTKPDGSFELGGLVPGPYHLTALWIDAGKQYTAETQLDVGHEDVEGVTLVLAPGFRLRGRVVFEGSAGEVDPEQVRVLLAQPEFGLLGRVGRADAEGRLEVENVSPGEYRVNVTGFGPDGYVKSVRYGDDEAANQLIRVTNDSDALEVVVSFAGARLEGAALDSLNQPMPGATVVLVPRDRSRLELFRSSSADQYGRFVLRGVAPGDYRLLAWEEVESGAWMDPDFLEPLERGAPLVTLRAGQQHTLDVKVLPADEDSAYGR